MSSNKSSFSSLQDIGHAYPIKLPLGEIVNITKFGTIRLHKPCHYQMLYMFQIFNLTYYLLEN